MTSEKSETRTEKNNTIVIKKNPQNLFIYGEKMKDFSLTIGGNFDFILKYPKKMLKIQSVNSYEKLFDGVKIDFFEEHSCKNNEIVFENGIFSACIPDNYIEMLAIGWEPFYLKNKVKFFYIFSSIFFLNRLHMNRFEMKTPYTRNILKHIKTSRKLKKKAQRYLSK